MAKSKSVETESSGKDLRTGKFVKGNKLGQGGPWARGLATFKARWDACITEDRIEEAHEIVWKYFKRGQPWAAKLWLEYTLGKPKESLEITGEGNQRITWAAVARASAEGKTDAANPPG